MSDFVFPPPEKPALAVRGTTRRFPVRRIFCVGSNYAHHVKEMGGDPNAYEPVFFTKPADAATNAFAIPYPPDTENLHHEVELVVALQAGGSDLAAGTARDAVFGYAVGVDLTRRDRQAEAKAAGRPWDIAKAFDFSAPLSEIAPAEACGHPESGRIWLTLDDVLKQDGDLSEMTLNPARLIAALSRSFTLRPGDLIFTGTPEGVGPIARGQTVEAGIEGVGELAIRVA